ncbi:FkbM family methyltransferase [Candidatus Neomarinimicrobiota bacterium]
MNEVLIAYRLLKNNSGSQVMIDVGAHFGGSLVRFAEDGWKVHAFEPSDKNRLTLEQRTKHQNNVIIETRALSDRSKDNVSFFESAVSAGISGLSAFHPGHVETQRISTITLRDYCAENNVTAIEFLKVDTEGFDLMVLKGTPWDDIAPRLIVCEFEDNKTVPLGYTYHDMALFLKAKGYRVMVSEWYPIIEYGAAHDWRCFNEYPTELAGGSLAWGNLIATRDESDFQKLKRLLWMINLRAKIRRIH